MPTFAMTSAPRRRAREETIEASYDALGSDIGVGLEPSR